MVDPDTRRFCFPATKNLVAPGVVGHHHPFICLGEENQKSPRQLDPPKPIQMNGTKSCVFQVGKIPNYETTIQATGKYFLSESDHILKFFAQHIPSWEGHPAIFVLSAFSGI